MVSKCTIFPFDVTGTVTSVTMKGNEIFLNVRVDSGKTLSVGVNTPELMYDFI